MEVTQVKRVSDNSEFTVLPQVWIARNYWQRLRGLLGRPALSEKQGLLISPCRRIHTFGMQYPLDIVFINPQGCITQICRSVNPNKQAHCQKAMTTLELLHGVAQQLNLQAGEQLAW